MILEDINKFKPGEVYLMKYCGNGNVVYTIISRVEANLGNSVVMTDMIAPLGEKLIGWHLDKHTCMHVKDIRKITEQENPEYFL